MALAMLYAAVRLPTGERMRRFAVGLLEAGLFMAFDLALIALLAHAGSARVAVA
jgi:hypothetical protein